MTCGSIAAPDDTCPVLAEAIQVLMDHRPYLVNNWRDGGKASAKVETRELVPPIFTEQDKAILSAIFQEDESA